MEIKIIAVLFSVAMAACNIPAVYVLGVKRAWLNVVAITVCLGTAIGEVLLFVIMR